MDIRGHRDPEKPQLIWRDLIVRSFPDAKFSAAASPADLEGAEKDLGLALPGELRSLLLETNGVAANYSAPLFWSVQEIVEQNRQFRANAEFPELYMPFDCLLFFGAEGNGDQFAYRILRRRIPDTSWIYEWDHETDSRSWFAANLEDYIRRAVPITE